MTERREMLRLALASAAGGLLTSRKSGAQLVFPDGFTPSIVAAPSPPATPFVAPLFRMPVAQPIHPGLLSPPPDPLRHQRFDEFPPQRFYQQHINEFLWQYHPEPPYRDGSWSWGFDGITPGPTYHAWYGAPIFLRRINDLPPLGVSNVRFALPSVTIHVHNGHQASESDGIPQDFFNPGEFWDHLYTNFPAGFDELEKLTTLWYHDHRLDFTATNVYAGLTGFYLYFDERDSNNERDRNRRAFRLPSGNYDIPLILHDVQFDQDGQVVWDFFNPEPLSDGEINPLHTTQGMLGDRFTVNRTIQPYLNVEPRKYRFRILNGGPSRFYDLHLRSETGRGRRGRKGEKFYVISTDGNLLPHPLVTKSINISVEQRHDVIIDFSHYKPGEHVYLVNRLEMRDDGAGPTGRYLDEGNLIMRFDVVGGRRRDPSRIPDRFRELPPIDFSEVRRERLFVFDYDNGLWTINGKLMDPNRVDAAIEQGSAEIWTFRNAGSAWSHPIHTHFEEFQIIEKNGRRIPKRSHLNSRKDVITLGPKDEIKFFGRWRDFLGKHVMHCHNVVHEDHAMMIRWDIVPPGQGD